MILRNHFFYSEEKKILLKYFYKQIYFMVKVRCLCQLPVAVILFFRISPGKQYNSPPDFYRK